LRPSPNWLPWLVVPLALASGGCTDNVTCVFAGSCQGGSGQLSDNEAALPVDGDWILDGAPRVDAFFPSGVTTATTPIVLVFSESMQAATLVNAVEIITFFGGIEGAPVVGVAQSLVCDGRVLVLLPTIDFEAGDYIVRLAQDAVPTDLTGQVLDTAPGTQLGTFSAADTPPAVPAVVMTFPANGNDNQSETGQILAVFDRPLNPASVNGASFDVRVNGADPPVDTPAAAIRIGSASVEDTRAYLYRSVDASAQPVPLGVDAEVELRLSPSGSPLQAEGGGNVAARTVTFNTLPFAAVRTASLMSIPHDAIGLANLTPGDADELMVLVEFDELQTNDSIDLFLFGERSGQLAEQPMIALQRTKRLTAVSPVLSVIFDRSEVAMQLSEDPADTRFRDGPVTFAFRARRGTVVTPLRVLDLEPDPNVIQDPLLDTTRPTIESLEGATSTSAFRSDLRGLSIAGQADEPLTSAEVTTSLGNNSASTAVVGAAADGTFLASPVALDVVAGGSTDFTLVGRDAARNATTSLMGTFTQLGVLGGTAHTPGAAIDVEVFDARTLLPLPGALVIVHSDLGTGSAFPFERSAATGADGRVQVTTNGAPSVATILTVVASGYDLFTLHGVPGSRLSVPLSPTNRILARASGLVRTEDPGATAFLPGLERRFDDSRRPSELPRGFVGGDCSTAQGITGCSYGPESIVDARLGARSVYAGNFLQAEGAFQAGQLVQAFALLLPLGGVDGPALQPANLDIDSLLTDPAAAPEDQAQLLPEFDFLVGPASGVDLLTLDDDPATSGVPFATVEVLIPGLPGALAVAPGLTYDQGGDRWKVKSAQPGAVTPAGSLGGAGSVDTDPYVRVEVVDLEGNAAGARPRLSALVAAGPSPEVRALDVPRQTSPAPAASTGAEEFTLLLDHAIGDDRTEGGLYRVELRDEANRAWTLWRFDPPGTAPIEIRVVDVGDAGVTGLRDGTLVSRTAAWAWNGLLPTDFLWTDIERRFELFSRGAPFSFLKP